MSGMRVGESRRSTRVPARFLISAQGLSEPLDCDGETIVVNRHGALISCAFTLRMGMKIKLHVLITDKNASAEVVYVDPERPSVYGIALDNPENIWGLGLTPEDWQDSVH